MTTIQLAHAVPALTVAQVESYIDHLKWYDCHWSGKDITVKRDDNTCIPDDDSLDAVVLLSAVRAIINSGQHRETH